MISRTNHPEQYGLIGVGTAGDWEATLSEVLSGESDDLLLEMSGPAVAIAIRIMSIDIAGKLRRMFIQRLEPHKSPSHSLQEVRLDEGLRLVADNEDIQRCFLIAKSSTGTVRLTLTEHDLRKLSECLEEAIDQARQETEPKAVPQPVEPG